MSTVLIMGIQASGVSAAALLEREGHEIRLYDDKVKLERNWKDAGEAVFKGLDRIVISPAIPNTHPVVVGAKERGIPIVSELQLGFERLPCEKIVVTGTNGKTTTVDMLTRMFQTAGKKARAMGNIGYPVSQVVLDGDIPEIAVIEASNFQLEYSNLHVHTAALLNLSPDHMDRYPTYEDYVNAKKRVFLNQTANDFAVLNYDNRILRELGRRLPSVVKWISAKERKGDVYLKNNYFYYADEPLVAVRESKAKGEHNRFNIMTALTIGGLYGVKREQMAAFVREYRVLPHRVEYVCTVGGKRYYNDSKGTNPGATKSAVETVGGKIGLILGGSDKKEDFCELFDALFDRVARVAVTGGNAEKIYQSALKVGYSEIEICPDLKAAIDYLAAADDVDTVLLSPASASFDRYHGYEERGNVFKQLVYALKD